MGDTAKETYVIVVQCDGVVHETCPGFMCEHAFNARADAFAVYPADQPIRYLPMSCGGCPGHAVLRKLMNVKKNLMKRENLTVDIAAVHLSTYITRSSHHGPRCPHLDRLTGQVEHAGFVCREDSRIPPPRREEACRRKIRGDNAQFIIHNA